MIYSNPGKGEQTIEIFFQFMLILSDKLYGYTLEVYVSLTLSCSVDCRNLETLTAK